MSTLKYILHGVTSFAIRHRAGRTLITAWHTRPAVMQHQSWASLHWASLKIIVSRAQCAGAEGVLREAEVAAAVVRVQLGAGGARLRVPPDAAGRQHPRHAERPAAQPEGRQGRSLCGRPQGGAHLCRSAGALLTVAEHKTSRDHPFGLERQSGEFEDLLTAGNGCQWHVLCS